MTRQEKQMASVSLVMGTKELTDAVYRSDHGKSFHNVAIGEAKLADKLLNERNFAGTAPLVSIGAGMDMSNVQKPIRGAEELAQILREEAGSVTMVSEDGPLPYNVLESVTHSSLLERVQEKRKAQHDIALKDYDQAVVNIAEELEERVIEQCRFLRDEELIEIDHTIQQELFKLASPIVVREMSHAEVKNIWKNTNILLIQRKEYVENYATFLGLIEADRTKRTGESLTAMAESVVAVGYVLRDEAVRLVETRSFAHNEVVTSNTKAFEVWFCFVFFIFRLLLYILLFYTP